MVILTGINCISVGSCDRLENGFTCRAWFSETHNRISFKLREISLNHHHWLVVLLPANSESERYSWDDGHDRSFLALLWSNPSLR